MKSLFLIGFALLLSACAPSASVQPTPDLANQPSTPTGPSIETPPSGSFTTANAGQPLARRADVQAFIR